MLQSLRVGAPLNDMYHSKTKTVMAKVSHNDEFHVLLTTSLQINLTTMQCSSEPETHADASLADFGSYGNQTAVV